MCPGARSLLAEGALGLLEGPAESGICGSGAKHRTDDGRRNGVGQAYIRIALEYHVLPLERAAYTLYIISLISVHAWPLLLD
jgi:hypothetical protein